MKIKKLINRYKKRRMQENGYFSKWSRLIVARKSSTFIQLSTAIHAENSDKVC